MKKFIDFINRNFSLASAGVGFVLMFLWMKTGDIAFVMLANFCCSLGLVWDQILDK